MSILKRLLRWFYSVTRNMGPGIGSMTGGMISPSSYKPPNSSRKKRPGKKDSRPSTKRRKGRSRF